MAGLPRRGARGIDPSDVRPSLPAAQRRVLGGGGSSPLHAGVVARAEEPEAIQGGEPAARVLPVHPASGWLRDPDPAVVAGLPLLRQVAVPLPPRTPAHAGKGDPRKAGGGGRRH